jgi:hypothetical protein
MVLGDQRLDEALAVLLESLDRSRLVALHQARVADDIGREDGARRRSARVAAIMWPPNG